MSGQQFLDLVIGRGRAPALVVLNTCCSEQLAALCLERARSGGEGPTGEPTDS